MNPLRFVTMKAEDVAQVWWVISDDADRRRMCRAADISEITAVLDWQDLQLVERIPLTMAIKFMIEADASRLRRVTRSSDPVTS